MSDGQSMNELESKSDMYRSVRLRRRMSGKGTKARWPSEARPPSFKTRSCRSEMNENGQTGNNERAANLPEGIEYAIRE